MAIITPFCGIRPAPDFAAVLAAPPYDVFTRSEAKAYVVAHPDSFLRIDRPETMFPDHVDMYAPEVYQKGADAFQEMLSSGQYLQDTAPCYYLYELKLQDHVQTGIIGCAAAADYENGIIRTHEKTRKDKEEDRSRHIDILNLQASPVFLTYRSDPLLSELTAAVKKEEPLYHFTGEDGLEHTFYAIFRPDFIEKISACFAGINTLYVADGHHRAASGDAVARSRRTACQAKPHAESEFILSILFPDTDLQLYPYHRIIADANGLSPEQLFTEIKKKCTIISTDPPVLPQKPHEIGMYFHKKWYILKAMESHMAADPVEGLDVAFLQREILNPVLGIQDPRTDSRIRFAGGSLTPEQLAGLTGQTPDGIAFAMYPVSMEEFFRVSDHGLLMPPKSTWFAPKPLSGLILHSLK